MALSVTLVLVLTLAPVHTLAEEEITQEQIEARLKALEEELGRYREMLDATEGQKTEIEQNLKKSEKGINDLINQIDEIEEELQGNEDKISRLEREQKELLGMKSEQQVYIEQQIRAAFEIGNQEYLKVLLNQEDPVELDRMMTFYDYFNRARSEQIARYNRTLEQLDTVSLRLATEIDVLAANRERLRQQEQALTAARTEQEALLGALLAQIRETGSEITRLEGDRSRLEELLERIETSIANLPIPTDTRPFADMRGKLVLPVSGSVAHRFGHRRNEGKLRWDGVFIDAEQGDPVHAVHYGRVVFSDWLRGFGLLMIISHGEGYMSLYGHNQALYRETGEWVNAGEVIATVGNSGGQNRHGLYFEIRVAGKPTDPQKWCVARNRNTA